MTARIIVLLFILSFVALNSYGSQPDGAGGINSTIENRPPADSENKESAEDPAEIHYNRAMELINKDDFDFLDDDVMSNILKELDSAIALNSRRAVYFKERGYVYSLKSLSESKDTFRVTTQVAFT